MLAAETPKIHITHTEAGQEKERELKNSNSGNAFFVTWILMASCRFALHQAAQARIRKHGFVFAEAQQQSVQYTLSNTGSQLSGIGYSHSRNGQG